MIDNQVSKIRLLGGQIVGYNDFGIVYKQNRKLNIHLINREIEEELTFGSVIILKHFIILLTNEEVDRVFTYKGDSILKYGNKRFQVYGEKGIVRNSDNSQFNDIIDSEMLLFAAYGVVVIMNKFGDTITTVADKPFSHYYVVKGKDIFYGSHWGNRLNPDSNTKFKQNEAVSDDIRVKYIDSRGGQVGYIIYQQDKPSTANSVPSKNKWILVTEDLKYFNKYDIVPWWWDK